MGNKTIKKVVIIGNGIAGVTAAETIRKEDNEVEIIIIDRENYPVYYKPMLSKFIGQDKLPGAFFVRKETWYEENNIQWLREHEVTSINDDARELVVSNGKESRSIVYDKLIIATGSYCFVPPIENNHLDNVFTLRTYDDALHIKEVMKEHKKATVIGGGLLGLELAAQLYQAGMEVTVVEIMERLLPRQLDQKGAEILENVFDVERMNVLKATGVKRLIGEDKVTGVETLDGRMIESDLVMISAGVRIDPKLAQMAGVDFDKAIIVNEYMQTSKEHIYACGDCACFEGHNFAIWPEAISQGQIAGANAIGQQQVYENFVPSTILHAMGLNIFSIGEMDVDEDEEGIAILNYEEKHAGVYKRMNFKDKNLIGGILVNDQRKAKFLIKGMKVETTLADLYEVLE
ncbi:FAD-dependent oxidoreductase [Vallitaleaceae bacterium 9-2]